MAGFLNVTWPSNLTINFNSYCRDCNEFKPRIEELNTESFSCEVERAYYLDCEHKAACERCYDCGWQERGRIDKCIVKTEENPKCKS